MPSYTESAMRSRGQRVDVVSDADYQFSRSLRGVPSNHHRVVRASGNCWDRGLRMSRTVGTGVGVFGESVYLDEAGELANSGTGTVKCTTSDGTRYRPVSDFRRERTSSRKAATAESPAERQARRDFEIMLAAGNTQADVD